MDASGVIWEECGPCEAKALEQLWSLAREVATLKSTYIECGPLGTKAIYHLEFLGRKVAGLESIYVDAYRTDKGTNIVSNNKVIGDN